jgi:hypothetical protein
MPLVPVKWPLEPSTALRVQPPKPVPPLLPVFQPEL